MRNLKSFSSLLRTSACINDFEDIFSDSIINSLRAREFPRIASSSTGVQYYRDFTDLELSSTIIFARLHPLMTSFKGLLFIDLRKVRCELINSPN